MNPHWKPGVILLTLFVLIGTACNLSEYLHTGDTTSQTETGWIDPTRTDTAIIPDMTNTAEIPAATVTVPVPTVNEGQIAYASEGNIWLYAVSTGSITQVTTGGIAGSYESEYQTPRLSADGRYLAYMKNNLSYIQNLVDGSVTNLVHHGRFFQWSTTPGEFYATPSDLDCPALENLEDQDQITVEVLRFSMTDIDHPEILGSISGGLRFPQTISNDSRWGSFLTCYCYSECGAYGAWHLPDGANRIPEMTDFYAGPMDFSPNSSQLAVSGYQTYGFVESPLYLANVDFTGMHQIYFAPGTASMNPHWSPDGAWIAFTNYTIDATGMEAGNSMAMLIHPDGSDLTIVNSDYAQFVDWSPDGSHLIYSTLKADSMVLYIYDLTDGTGTFLPITGTTDLDWGILP